MCFVSATWKIRKEHRAKVQAEIDKRNAAIKEEQDKADLAALAAAEEAVAARETELASRAAAKAAGQPVNVAPLVPPSQTPKREHNEGGVEDEEDGGEAKDMDQGDDNNGGDDEDDDADQDPEPEPEPVAKKAAITKKAVPLPVPTKKVVAPPATTKR